MRELRIKCKACGERFTVFRIERERISKLCDACKADREREQARARMAAMRLRRSYPAGDNSSATVAGRATHAAATD